LSSESNRQASGGADLGNVLLNSHCGCPMPGVDPYWFPQYQRSDLSDSSDYVDLKVKSYVNPALNDAGVVKPQHTAS